MAAMTNVHRALGAGRPLRRDQIDTGQEREVRYWSARLGCSADELRGAIRVVGRSIARVREYVARRRQRFAGAPTSRMGRVAS